MTDVELADLVARIKIEGWNVTVNRDTVTFTAAQAPIDSRAPGVFTGLYGEFSVPNSWTPKQVWTRLFCNIQYLRDHELREQFLVDGERPYDPHEPFSATGMQKEWFVERQSALRGY